MSFLEYIGPEKALFYGLAAGFVLGILFSMWCEAKP
jgi:hypothetical protein